MTSADAARPRPRAFWADARFLLGIVLIVVSVAGVWLIVAAARQTAPVFAAARTIVPGEAVAADDLRVVEVALGSLAEGYASPASLVPGMVALRTVAAGELVPHAALGEPNAVASTTIALRSSGDVPSAVTTGTVVEVWAAPPLEQGEFDAPRILVPAATVVSITRDDSMMGRAAAVLDLVVDRADVADLLGAMAGGAEMSVVPTTGAPG